MKSKISFFNSGLFKSSLRRFWPLWIAHFGGWFIFMPVLTLVNSLGPSHESGYVYYITENAIFISSVIACVMGLLAAMAVFSFMYNSRGTGLIAALPVRREAVFGSAWLGSAAAVIISNLVIALLTFLFSLGTVENTALAFKTVCIWFGVYSMQFILFFGIASLIAVFTGSIVVLPVLFAIFNFFAVGMEYVIRLFFSFFVWGMSNVDSTGVFDFLSPVVNMLGNFDLTIVYYTGNDEVNLVREVYYENWVPTIIYCAVGILLSVAALMIFRKRKMEAAGDVIAVPCLRPVFKYGTAVCSALCGGMLLFVVIDSLFNNRSVSALIMIPCMILFAFIGYFGAKMLLEKSFHVFRGSWVGFIVTCCLCAVFTLCCDLDVFNIGGFVPDKDDVKSMVVYYDQDIQNAESISEFRSLQEKIVSQKDKYKNLSDIDADNITATFTYKLKNGRTVSRAYILPYEDENYTEYCNLLNSPAIVLEYYSASVPIDTDHCSGAGFSDSYFNYGFSLSPEQAVDFYENAVVADIKAGNLKIVDDNDYLGSVSFYLSSDNGDAEDGYEMLSVDITTGCTECLSWIKDNCNIDLAEAYASLFSEAE